MGPTIGRATSYATRARVAVTLHGSGRTASPFAGSRSSPTWSASPHAPAPLASLRVTWCVDACVRAHACACVRGRVSVCAHACAARTCRRLMFSLCDGPSGAISQLAQHTETIANQRTATNKQLHTHKTTQNSAAQQAPHARCSRAARQPRNAAQDTAKHARAHVLLLL